MSNHTRVWDESAPDGAVVAAYDLDTVIQNLKTDMRERLNLEHNLPATGGVIDDTQADAEGRHKAGIAGIMFYGTTAQIAALTGMGNGALAFDTTTGQFKVYILATATWTAINLIGNSTAPTIVVDTVYQATTDGFLTCIFNVEAVAGKYGHYAILVGATSSPTDIRGYVSVFYNTTPISVPYCSTIVPVKAGFYYKVTKYAEVGTVTKAYRWTALA